MPAAAKQNRQPGPARSQLELHQLRLHLRSARPPAPAAAWPAGGPPPRPAPRSGRSMPSSAWPQRPAPGRVGVQGRMGTADGKPGAGCLWPFGRAAALLAGAFKLIDCAALRTCPPLVSGRTLTSQSLRAAWSVPSASLGCHSSSCCSVMPPAALARRYRHAFPSCCSCTARATRQAGSAAAAVLGGDPAGPRGAVPAPRHPDTTHTGHRRLQGRIDGQVRVQTRVVRGGAGRSLCEWVVRFNPITSSRPGGEQRHLERSGQVALNAGPKQA